MNNLIDLCFLCTKDYNCVLLDDRVISQVEYVLPEVTVIKLGIPLRICSVCNEALCSFNKFKQCSVEVSRRLEARLRPPGAPGLRQSGPGAPPPPPQFQAVYIKEEQLPTDTSLPEPTNPLHRDAFPQTQAHTTDPFSGESVFIKEELLDETSQDRTVYKSMLHDTVNDNRDSQIEHNTKDKSFGITKEAEEIELNLLPVKSREKYEKEYDVFKNWMNENNITIINEDVILTYLQGKSKVLKSASVWSKYFMLKATLSLKEKLNIDRYSKVTAFLKSNSVGYEPTKSKVLSKNEVNTFLREANDDMYLMIKMPENQRKTRKAEWDSETMEQALNFVKNGGSIRQAGRRFNIPESSIRKRKKAFDNGEEVVGPHVGKHCVFSGEEEKKLKDQVLKLAKLFHGMTKSQLRKLAFSYAEANHIKHNFNTKSNMAGKYWYYGFLKRNPEISLRKSLPTGINRVAAFNKKQVTIFFKNLKKLYIKYKFKKDRIFNVDETAISTVQKSADIKQFGAKTAERGMTVTVICCFNASGCYVPPMFIFPRFGMTNTLTKNGPPNAIYSCSKTGWSNEELFYQWLQHFKKTVKPSKDDPVLLVLDNHSSHVSLPIFDFCEEHGIVIIIIPPHTSHKLQPLDISFYEPLKSEFNKQCDYHLTTSERLLLYDVAEIFNTAYTSAATVDKGLSGFRASGIWPYQPDKFTSEEFVPTSHHLPVVTDDELPSSPSGTPREVISEKNKNDVSEPGTSSVNLEDLSPLPNPHCNRNQNLKKIQILTDTPDREKLEEASTKRLERKRRIEEKQNKTKKKDNNSKRPKKNCEDSSSEDISESELCDDNESDNELDNNDKCVICDDGSKKDDMWFKCSVCQKWAHALCSGVDSPEGYVCDLCDV